MTVHRSENLAECHPKSVHPVSTNSRSETAATHPLEVLPYSLQCRDSRIEPGELLLDRSHDPLLLCAGSATGFQVS